jgi:hypothetical protein
MRYDLGILRDPGQRTENMDARVEKGIGRMKGTIEPLRKRDATHPGRKSILEGETCSIADMYDLVFVDELSR